MLPDPSEYAKPFHFKTSAQAFLMLLQNFLYFLSPIKVAKSALWGLMNEKNIFGLDNRN
jgi:hypothetical protein